MKYLRFLNPQSWAGQMIVFLSVIMIGAAIGFMAKERISPCPPQNVNQIGKLKTTGKSQLNADISTGQGCDDWLRSLSPKEIRKIRK